VYTLDTNIIIYYFNGEVPILAFLREQTEQGSPRPDILHTGVHGSQPYPMARTF
jgi:hypothetical protein